AQLFTRSGTAEVVWKESGITSFCQLRSHRVGVWLSGSQFEQLAALERCGIDPHDKNDVMIVPQAFGMQAFLKHQIDAASADTFNELALVLETTNPTTGKLYSPDDLTVFKMQNLGTATLE